MVALLAVALVVGGCGTGSGVGRGAAKIERVAEATPVAGPVLYGHLVAWGEGGEVEGDPIEHPLLVLVASPDISPRVVHEQRLTKRRPMWWFGDFAASPNLLVAGRRWGECDGGGSCGLNVGDAVVWTRPDSSDRLAPKPCGDTPLEIRDLDVSGIRMAFTEIFCVPRGFHSRLVVDDVADDDPPLLLKKNYSGDVRLAGEFVAWRPFPGGDIVVFDLRRKRVSYRAHIPESDSEIDLQADGKLVAAWTSGTLRKVAWFSPEQPSGHPVAVSPVRAHPGRIAVRFADDHIAFEAELSERKSVLAVADLNGHTRLVASFDRLHRRVGDFDFDGKRLTWASQHVLRFEKHCNGPPSYWQRRCWRRPIGPTTIYLAQLD